MDRQPTPAADISRREAEVLALVGEHLTNAEIAERLFISVRTVESHVASLLRKLDLPDKRALAAHAGLGESPRADEVPTLPVPLTSFVGRAVERAALSELLAAERLVTALGPGGVGKTRLATAVAADVADRFEGVWFVDLVPVADGALVADAVVRALAIPERAGGTLTDAVATWIGDRRLLVVLDNCEHLVDGVAVFVEALLSRCPRLVVLATSRARLTLPFESIFSVAGLSLPDEDAAGDAVTLFEARAAAVGAAPFGPAERARVADVCRQLDGVPLALELAASRLPSLGFDGLEAGLAEPLRVLAGGARVGDRHRSLRATFDWSWSLLDERHRSLLEQVSVFAAPFAAADAAAVVAPAESLAATVEALARLADSSLLVTVPGPTGMRYRALEEVRQYGAERLGAEALAALRERHLRWCLATARGLAERQAQTGTEWRPAFDAVAPDIRAALLHAAGQPTESDDAWQLTALLARLAFARGTPREALASYQRAAELAPTASDRLTALLDAACAAWSAQTGNESLRLLGAVTDLAAELGDTETYVVELAHAAELILRAPGIFAEPLGPQEAQAFFERAAAAPHSGLRANAAVAVADAYLRFDDADRGQRAVRLARESGDPRLVSAALDQLVAVHLSRDDLAAAADAMRERVALLSTFAPDVRGALELIDGHLMAADVFVATGDLIEARRHADALAALPFVSEERTLTTSRQLRVDVFIGDVLPVLERAERFRLTWERAGRPTIGQLAPSAWAVAAAYGLRGDDEAAQDWREIAALLRPAIYVQPDDPGGWAQGYPPVLDALVLLHRGEAEAALRRLPEDPAQGAASWSLGLWRPWAAALIGEAAVLAGRPGAVRQLDALRGHVAANPVAAAMLDRAAALTAGDLDAVLGTVPVFERAGCRYQCARTLVLAGGPHRAQGVAAMTELGIATVAA